MSECISGADPLNEALEWKGVQFWKGRRGKITIIILMIIIIIIINIISISIIIIIIIAIIIIIVHFTLGVCARKNVFCNVFLTKTNCKNQQQGGTGGCLVFASDIEWSNCRNQQKKRGFFQLESVPSFASFRSSPAAGGRCKILIDDHRGKYQVC